MSQFIHHTLMLLEDVGMSVRYPEIRHVTLEEGGKITTHMSFSSVIGTRVSIEQNPQMKFMMIFALLDFHVDATHPGMEGKSYKKKYENLPVNGDFNLIIRQLFRVAKVIRNALVHNPSAFSVGAGHLTVSYSYGGTTFSVKMSAEALANFYTMIVMYLKGDMGKGSYFIGIVRSIYRSFLAGISSFSDEFGSALEKPSAGTEIKPHARQVFLNPEHEAKEGRIRIVIPERKIHEWEGMDFHISYNGDDFLIPSEVLDSALSISEHDLVNNWKREGRFPQIKKP
ncbi:hypothetical protein [Burkholderia stagnalis]